MLLLLGGAAIVIAQRRGNDGEPAPETGTEVRAPRQPSLFLPVFGVLLAAAGALALLEATGTDVPWTIALAAGAIGIGVVVAAGAFLRRRTGGLVVVGIMLATLAVTVSAIDVRLDGPIGDRTFRPFDAATVQRTYDVSIGSLTVDLTNAGLSGDREIDANVGIGELRVVVPTDVAVDVDASASAGDVVVFGGPGRRSERKGVGTASALPARATRCTSTRTSASGRSSSRGRSASPMVDVGTIPARDRANGVVAGVAAGIARALEVDPTLVRLLFALLDARRRRGDRALPRGGAPDARRRRARARAASAPRSGSPCCSSPPSRP